MTSAVHLKTILGATLLVPFAAFAADAAAGKAIGKLLEGGELQCEPSMPVFCANIHVSCAIPSSIKSFPFRLRAVRDRGSITAPASADADVVQPYRDGPRITWAADDTYVILEPREGKGYLKFNADGSYNIRYYLRNDVWMVRGSCE